jgi:hypothetical protein
MYCYPKTKSEELQRILTSSYVNCVHEQLRLAVAHRVLGKEIYSGFPSGCDCSLSSGINLTTCSQHAHGDMLLQPFEAQLHFEYVDELVNHLLEVVLAIEVYNRDLSPGDVLGHTGQCGHVRSFQPVCVLDASHPALLRPETWPYHRPYIPRSPGR